MTLAGLPTLKRTFLLCVEAAELVTSSVPYSVKCGLNSLSSPTYLECEVCWGGEGEGRHVTKIRW